MYLIGITHPFGEKLLMEGVVKKTDPYDYLGHLVPLLGGDFNED